MQYRPIRFPTGEVRATTAALANISMEKLIHLVNRHIRGDWGDTCEEDREQNDISVVEGKRILAVYKYNDDTTIWIITEWDRSVTTILFPHEY